MSRTIEWDNYIVDRHHIGKGSFAKVYHGINKITNQEVAIKKISFGQLHDSIKSRTVSEISILQSLKHPNIIQLYSHKFDNDILLLIMEYCSDGDLMKWIKKDKTPDEIYNVIKQIVEGMSYLHKNKIIHRDIKPQNILLHNSKIKICDFGFSQTYNEGSSLFKTICGTPLYMSPEVINLMPYTLKSEIWSLGVLFYNIFFDEHPYGYLTSISDYKSKLKSPIEFKEIEIFSDQFYNDTFNDLIQKMLSLNPEYRPDIDYILDEINKCSSNESDDIFNMDENHVDNKMEQNNTLFSLNIGTKSIYKSAFSTNYLESEKTTHSNSFINSPINNLNINLMKPPNITLDGLSLSRTIIIENYF